MHLFLIAGEPSGDRLGAALIAGLRTLMPELSVSGVGGPAMQAEGVESLFDMEALSVMGLAEVLPRLPELIRLRDRTVDAIARARPDAVVTIDSPDFTLRVAARARRARRDLPVVHYVAPSVWAWRKGRAARMAQVVDHVLALLPFEPPHMRAVGMSCDFTGHPIVSEPRAGAEEIAAIRARAGGEIALVLPGSRRGEVERLTPVLGEALARLPTGHRVVIPTLPHLAKALGAQVATWPGDPILLTDPLEKRAAFDAAKAALAVSGSVSLELAASGTPMVIVYDMNWVTWQVVSRLMRIDTATLVNLVTGRKAVPEFLGPACRSGPVGEAFRRLLLVPSERAAQADALELTMERLGRDGPPPGLRAARALLDHLAK